MAKIICAKKVSASDMTYEEINEQCEKVFRIAYKDITLNSDPTGTVRKEQTERIQELENQNEQLRKKSPPSARAHAPRIRSKSAERG